jgi:hypothetical protein
MSKPTEDFWAALGFGLLMFCVLAGFALVAWATGAK